MERLHFQGDIDVSSQEKRMALLDAVFKILMSKECSLREDGENPLQAIHGECFSVSSDQICTVLCLMAMLNLSSPCPFGFKGFNVQEVWRRA